MVRVPKKAKSVTVPIAVALKSRKRRDNFKMAEKEGDRFIMSIAARVPVLKKSETQRAPVPPLPRRRSRQPRKYPEIQLVTGKQPLASDFAAGDRA